MTSTPTATLAMATASILSMPYAKKQIGWLSIGVTTIGLAGSSIFDSGEVDMPPNPFNRK